MERSGRFCRQPPEGAVARLDTYIRVRRKVFCFLNVLSESIAKQHEKLTHLGLYFIPQVNIFFIYKKSFYEIHTVMVHYISKCKING